MKISACWIRLVACAWPALLAVRATPQNGPLVIERQGRWFVGYDLIPVAMSTNEAAPCRP